MTDPTALILTEWANRVESEYRWAAISQHLGLWLLQMGASPDLVRATLRSTNDSLTHAELALAVLRELGEGMNRSISQDSLGLLRRPQLSLEEDTLLVALEHFAFAASLKQCVARRQREVARAPTAVAALDRMVADFGEQGALGWHVLDWMLSRPARVRHQQVVEAALADIAARVVVAPAWSVEPPPAILNVWGLLPLAEHGQLVQSCQLRIWNPRLAARGFEPPAR
jgi:hypothetical protein